MDSCFVFLAVAHDLDLELRGEVGGGFHLLALLAFLPSVISSFLTQNKGCRSPRALPLDPPLSYDLKALCNETKGPDWCLERQNINMAGQGQPKRLNAWSVPRFNNAAYRI